MSRIRRYNATTRLWEYVDSILPGSTPIVSFTPQIVVTAPTGSTVTCVKGSTSITATEVSGVWTFNVTSYGEWTVTVTSNEVSRYEIVSVIAVQQYNANWNDMFPIGYTKIEYIEANGTQYINTGVTVYSKHIYQIELKSPSTTNISYTGGYFGNYGGLFYRMYDGYYSGWHHYGIFNVYDGQGAGGGARVYMNLNTKYDIEMLFKQGEQHLKVNGEIKQTGSYTFDTSYMQTLNLFANLGVDNLNIFDGDLKWYKSLIYDVDDNLIRNLVPCYRNSDDKPGMYDLVNNVFYTNAGTGEFIIPTT